MVANIKQETQHLMRRAGIPRDCLQGLEGYSHCWLLYVFHENTDLGRLWRPGADADRGLKGKVPRICPSVSLPSSGCTSVLRHVEDDRMFVLLMT